jgi:hypothetical protein
MKSDTQISFCIEEFMYKKGTYLSNNDLDIFDSKS